MKSYILVGLCVVMSATYITFVHPMDAAAVTPEVVKWDRLSSFDEGITSTASENDARGNWYIKRKFLIDARGLYEHIKQRVPEIAASEKMFLELRDTIANEIAQFYKELGFEQQSLDTSLTATIEALEQERLKNMQLTEQEREVLSNLEMTKKELVQVQQDMRILSDNENAITRAMPILTQQIDVCVQYEQQAFDKYERIAEVLNDHLAEQLYRDIQSYLNHINAIDGYLKGQFHDYFNQTIAMIRAQMAALKVAFNKLQEQGIVFESQATQELRAAQKIQEDAHKQQQPKQLTFIERIVQFFKTIGSYIAYPFVWLGNQVARLWKK